MTGDLVSRDEKKESIREHLINAKLAEVGPETFDSQASLFFLLIYDCNDDWKCLVWFGWGMLLLS